jgi:outer membrane protein assembly factor BamA
MTLSKENINHTTTNSLDRQVVQQDITVNSTLGARLSVPLETFAQFQSGFSTGFDYKQYALTSYKTNILTVTAILTDPFTGAPIPPTSTSISVIPDPLPTTSRSLAYLPLALRYDASLRDSRGVTAFGLGLSADAWYSGSASNLQSITGSSESSGNWFILNPSLSRDFLIHTNWILSLHAEGQWATQPLISNEQFGLGGVNSVRGYQEGEVFGDTGWWIGVEQKTPPKVVGMVYRNHPLTVRGSVFMEYGQVYLLDPQGRPDRTALWGTGLGGVASIGATWEARLLLSWPLLTAGTTHAGVPRLNLSLSAQF